MHPQIILLALLLSWFNCATSDNDQKRRTKDHLISKHFGVKHKTALTNFRRKREQAANMGQNMQSQPSTVPVVISQARQTQDPNLMQAIQRALQQVETRTCLKYSEPKSVNSPNPEVWKVWNGPNATGNQQLFVQKIINPPGSPQQPFLPSTTPSANSHVALSSVMKALSQVFGRNNFKPTFVQSQSGQQSQRTEQPLPPSAPLVQQSSSAQTQDSQAASTTDPTSQQNSQDDQLQTPVSPPEQKQIVPMTESQRKSALANCRIVTDIDCTRVFQGDKSEIAKARNWTIPRSLEITPADIDASASCSDILKKLQFEQMAPLSTEERDHSLAFAIMVTDGIFSQLVRLLRRIYWPQNAYCIHVGTQVKDEFRRATMRLQQCLDKNVVLAKPEVEFAWGSPLVVTAARQCLRQLYKMKIPWKYALIVTENDMPLRTNKEMVQITKVMGGANDAELKPEQMERELNIFVYRNGTWQVDKKVKKTIAPAHIRPFKGSYAATLSRDFVRFFLHSRAAKEFFNWTLNTAVAGEKLWSSLIHNLHLNPPGGFPGVCIDYPGFTKEPRITRYESWPEESHCKGDYRERMCTYGVGDLPIIVKQPHLLVTKFEESLEPAAKFCLDEFVCNRTFADNPPEKSSQDPKLSFKQFEMNDQFYEDLPAVKFHKLEDKSKYVCQKK